eukprot:TRINITY_DN36_c0_g1_i1.p1 TRINITY_DN36_c0_g1~~TRINITY_DN36_c0_g1_i1.p1  ORF type:complete len:558 (-),score=93.04 TRINITY_DN36_c0_g1_i1:235-1908(-)
MAQGKQEKEVGIVGEASNLLPSEKRTPKALKPEPKIAKKSPNQSPARAKEAKVTPPIESPNQSSTKTEEAENTQVKSPNKNSAMSKEQGEEKLEDEKKGAHEEEKEKNVINESNEQNSQNEQKNKETLGGVIFMCSSQTKPECFRYMVMGLPLNRQDLVMCIKPGLKLFLYDFNQRLMHGIYQAVSAGGMKLEPAAFNGAFPAQVRFMVHKSCFPLPENIFKEAIKENYTERNMFRNELTVKQVEKLTEVFRVTPQSQSSSHSVQITPAALVPLPHPRPVLLPVPAMGIPVIRREALPQHYMPLPPPRPVVPPVPPVGIPGVRREALPHYYKQVPLPSQVMPPVEIPEIRREALPQHYMPLPPPRPVVPPVPPVGIPGVRREALPHYYKQVPLPSQVMPPVEIPEIRREALPQYYKQLGYGREHLSVSTLTEMNPIDRKPIPRDALSLSEKQYRTYGLGREDHALSLLSQAPAVAPYPAPPPSAHPTDAYRSVRDPYHPHLYGRGTGQSQRREDEMEYKMQGVASQPVSARMDRGPENGSMPVSARYAFAGPSVSYR